MEDEPDVSEPLVRRSERIRVQRTSDGIVSNPRDIVESADELVEPGRKRNRTRTAEASPSTTTAKAFDQKLIDVVKTNGKFIPQVVKSWVERYEKDPKPAMVELLTMLFEACGATYHIQEDFMDQTNVNDIVVSLVNLAQQGRIEDYQKPKTKEFRSLKKNLVSFLDNLVAECQNGPLFDQLLFNKFMDYVIALSCTSPRVYRHVASIVGLQMVTSFIRAANILSASCQLTAEKITSIEKMMLKISTGLFMDRYRDVDPEIRMLCIKSLGKWIVSYPSLFLHDSYLKYLGITLNDKNGGVRKASVLALQNLYDMDANVASLGPFTEQFKKRMLDLPDDDDLSVAVCAINLVKPLLRHQLVSDDDLVSLYDLLIDEPPEIRRAMGSLVYDHFIAQNSNNSQSCDDSSRVHIMRMLELLRKYSGDELLITYVIDDIWEFMDAFKDWNCIISILLDDNCSIELTDDDVTNLTRLLYLSVKKSVGERIVPEIENKKQTHTKAQIEMIERNRNDITVAMMNKYPQLMRIYMTEKKKVTSLVEIICHMNLELYSLKNLEQSFKTVVEMMIEAFFRNIEKDGIRSCVKAINFCTTGIQGDLQDFTLNKLKKLEKDLILKLKAAIKQVADGGDEYSLVVNMKRLYELQLLKHVPIENLYDDFVMVLKSFRHIGDEVVSFVLVNMYLHVVWCLTSIMNIKVVSEESVSSLVSKRNILFNELHYFLQIPFEPSRNLLSSRVCTILAEAWCLFKKPFFESTQLECLGYVPDISTFRSFWKICVQLVDVFDETEEGKKEYVEETDRDAVMIAVAKLLAAETIPEEYLQEHLGQDMMSHDHDISVAQNMIIALTKNKKMPQPPTSHKSCFPN